MLDYDDKIKCEGLIPSCNTLPSIVTLICNNGLLTNLHNYLKITVWCQTKLRFSYQHWSLFTHFISRVEGQLVHCTSNQRSLITLMSDLTDRQISRPVFTDHS